MGYIFLSHWPKAIKKTYSLLSQVFANVNIYSLKPESKSIGLKAAHYQTCISRASVQLETSFLLTSIHDAGRRNIIIFIIQVPALQSINSEVLAKIN